jgi:hypothetical protein
MQYYSINSRHYLSLHSKGEIPRLGVFSHYHPYSPRPSQKYITFVFLSDISHPLVKLERLYPALKIIYANRDSSAELFKELTQ